MRAALAALLLAPAWGVGPAWTWSDQEAPAGEKSMGTWTSAVYTEEQQARLGVTETGEAAPAAQLTGWTVTEGERCYGGLPDEPGLLDEAVVESMAACGARASETAAANAFTYCELCENEGWGQNCWVWTLPEKDAEVEGVTWCDTPDLYQKFSTGRAAAPPTALARFAARARAFLGH